MIVWLIALPALVGGAIFAAALLRRRGRRAVRALTFVNRVLVLAAVAPAGIVLAAGPVSAHSASAAAVANTPARTGRRS